MTLLTAERKELSLMNSLTRENSIQGMREVKAFSYEGKENLSPAESTLTGWLNKK